VTWGQVEKVLRGGGWNNNEAFVRAANRNHNQPDNRNNNIGFRCVVAPGVNTRGQVPWVYGGRASAERYDARSVPGWAFIIDSSTKDTLALPGVVGFRLDAQGRAKDQYWSRSGSG
jgi:hypothetical protein